MPGSSSSPDGGGRDTTEERPAVDLRIDRPTPARVYDYFLGGKDNYASDRQAAEQITQALGNGAAEGARENRLFLRRVVAWLARAGIDQFIDIGAGLPTQDNTHQVAQRFNPDARVVYVDNDRCNSGCVHGLDDVAHANEQVSALS